ncbi:MAG: hypothetical protein EBR49_15995 [Betaproteobacteria bacterium]|nr:hypothetical protein [Betaproteobacteria bacterium]
MTTPYTPEAFETEAWAALKQLGDTAVSTGGMQALLQMFISVVTSAEEVARVSEEAGHPESMTTQVISEWVSTQYVPDMQAQLQTPGAA